MSRPVLTPWDHLVLACFIYSLIAWFITGWIAFNPADANWRAYAAIASGHLWGLAGLVWARGHDW